MLERFAGSRFVEMANNRDATLVDRAGTSKAVAGLPQATTGYRVVARSAMGSAIKLAASRL